MNENWIQGGFKNFCICQTKLYDHRKQPSSLLDFRGLIQRVAIFLQMFEGFINFPKASPNCSAFASLFSKAPSELSSSLIFSSSIVMCGWHRVRLDSSPTSLSSTSWNLHLSQESSLSFAIDCACSQQLPSGKDRRATAGQNKCWC